MALVEWTVLLFVVVIAVVLSLSLSFLLRVLEL